MHFKHGTHRVYFSFLPVKMLTIVFSLFKLVLYGYRWSWLKGAQWQSKTVVNSSRSPSQKTVQTYTRRSSPYWTNPAASKVPTRPASSLWRRWSEHWSEAETVKNSRSSRRVARSSFATSPTCTRPACWSDDRTSQPRHRCDCPGP